MPLKSPVRLADFFDQAQLYLPVAKFNASASLKAMGQKPAIALGAAFALAAGSVFFSQGNDQELGSQAAAPARFLPPVTVSMQTKPADRISVDAEAPDADLRAQQLARLEKLFVLPALKKQDVLALQQTLNDMDHEAGPNDGIFGVQTASGVISALKAHPHLAAKASSFIVESLLMNGKRRAFSGLIGNNPEIRAQALKVIDDPHAKTRDKQIWLSAFGLYKDSIDNIRGRNTIAAITQFRNLGIAPAPVAVPSAEPDAEPPSLVRRQPAPAEQEPDPAASATTVGTPLTREEIIELETILQKGGYYQKRPEGKFTHALGGALIEYLNDHQDQLPQLSPWVLQNMMKHNYQQDLVAMMYRNPVVEKAIREKISDAATRLPALDSRSLAETQIWMKMTGLYTGPVTGRTSKSFQTAMRDFNGFTSRRNPVETGAEALAQNRVFRDAVKKGDMRTIVRMAEALDPLPARLVTPLPVMVKTSDFKPHRKTRLDRHPGPHRGTDYGAPEGTSIRAPMDGVVVFNGPVSKYGNTIILSHGHGIHTLMAHRLRKSDRLAVGDSVRAGDHIGRVGSTGKSTNPHLHFEIILHDPSGRPITVNADKFAARDLKDPQVQQEAIADARLTMKSAGHRAMISSMAPYIPADKPVITAHTARRLRDVFAVERELAHHLPAALEQAITRENALSGSSPTTIRLARSHYAP